MTPKNHAEKTKRRRDRARLRPYNPSDHWHGTTSGYSNHCCRCAACSAAYKAYNDEWRKRPHVAERRRELARQNARKPEARLRARAKQYGIDKEQLASYLSDGVCFACGAKDVRLAVDHDHECCPSRLKACGECVRGLLCDRCNKALGLVEDNPDHLLDLVAYLDRWERNRARQ